MSLPLNVLYVNSQGTLGGVERFLDSVLKHHNTETVRPVLLSCQDGDWLDHVRDHGIKVYCLENARLRQPTRCFREIGKILQAEKVDVVHSSYAWCHALVSPAATWHGCKQVWFHHGPVWPQRWQGIMPLVPADLVLTNSRFLLNELRKTFYSAKRVGVVHYSLDTRDWFPQAELRAIFRKQWNVDNETVAVGIAGFLDDWKGQDVFLEAAFALRKQRLPLRMFIIGGPRSGSASTRCLQFESKLRNFVRDRQLEDIVSFTGHLDTRNGALDGIDIFVHASTTPEPFGMTILEAMAKGKPVIASAEGGPAEIIADGIDGLLVPPRRPNELAAAIRFLCDEPEKRNQLGAKGLNKVTTVFSPKRATEKLECWYMRLTSCDDGPSDQPGH